MNELKEILEFCKEEKVKSQDMYKAMMKQKCADAMNTTAGEVFAFSLVIEKIEEKLMERKIVQCNGGK